MTRGAEIAIRQRLRSDEDKYFHAYPVVVVRVYIPVAWDVGCFAQDGVVWVGAGVGWPGDGDGW